MNISDNQQLPADLPTFDQLIFPTLVALHDLGGSGSIDEINDKVVQSLNLSESALNYRRERSSLNEVPYRSAWARTYLKKFGAIERTGHGVWTLTPLGRSVDRETATGIPSEIRRLQKKHKPLAKELEALDPDLAADIEAEVSADWKEKLLGILHDLDLSAFERLSQRVLRDSGFVKVEVTGRSGDGGIDGIGVLRIKLISFQVLFQCKKYRGAVGAPAIRDFRGAMVGRSDKGLMITTGRFTADALREATRDGAPPIELIDGHEFCSLLKELKIGVSTEMVESVKVDGAIFNAI